MLRFFRRKPRKDLPPEPDLLKELRWPFRMILKLRFNPFAGRVFFHDIMCMTAKMACIDGPANEVELRMYTQLIEREFSLSEKQRKKAERILFEANHSRKTFGDFAREFYRYFRNEPAILENAFDVLLAMVYADNHVSFGEQRLIAEAAEIFGLPFSITNQLVNRHHNDKTIVEKPVEHKGKPGQEYEKYFKHEERERQRDKAERQGKREEKKEYKQERRSDHTKEDRKQQPSTASDVWFTVLQVDPFESHQKVKKRYRKLVQQYHPDKLPSNIPEEMKRASTERFIAIQKAYEQYLSLRRDK